MENKPLVYTWGEIQSDAKYINLKGPSCFNDNENNMFYIAR